MCFSILYWTSFSVYIWNCSSPEPDEKFLVLSPQHINPPKLWVLFSTQTDCSYDIFSYIIETAHTHLLPYGFMNPSVIGISIARELLTLHTSIFLSNKTWLILFLL